ncbi:MAG: hypothetical protein JXA42_19040 [Anaerolineales bacterium]|nr:hypothetical protein [Anaerolineales bacterium]
MKTDRHIIIVLLCLLFFGFISSACTPKFKEIEINGVQVDIRSPGEQEVDLDLIIESSSSQVQAVLPNAFLVLIQFQGQCKDLVDLEGKFNIMFIQVSPGFPQRRLVRALATVYTEEEEMDIQFHDVSDKYPSTELLVMNEDLSMREIAEIAKREINDIGLESCDVLINGFGDYWLVECTVSGSGVLGERICIFGIDAITGRVLDDID